MIARKREKFKTKHMYKSRAISEAITETIYMF